MHMWFELVFVLLSGVFIGWVFSLGGCNHRFSKWQKVNLIVNGKQKGNHQRRTCSKCGLMEDREISPDFV